MEQHTTDMKNRNRTHGHTSVGLAHGRPNEPHCNMHIALCQSGWLYLLMMKYTYINIQFSFYVLKTNIPVLSQ